MIRYPPSLLASAALYLSNRIFKKKDSWDEVMVRNTRYSEKELRACAKA
jgi:cyclin B